MNYSQRTPLGSDGIDRFIGPILRGSLSRDAERIGSTYRAGIPPYWTRQFDQFGV